MQPVIATWYGLLSMEQTALWESNPPRLSVDSPYLQVRRAEESMQNAHKLHVSMVIRPKRIGLFYNGL